MFKAVVFAGLSLSSLALSNFAHADWQLNNEKSQLSFVSIKKESIGEAHHFKRMQGTLSSEGSLTIKIDLTSGETLIPIRNERLSKLLFEADTFPHAVLTANLNAVLTDIKLPGHYVVKQIQGELDFHGVKKALSFDVLITKTAQGDLSVSSFSPVIINSADFGVTDGVMQLQKLAGLPSIATAVPVTFALSFNKL
jgi:polyisoprenoid-binding protein YceI